VKFDLVARFANKATIRTDANAVNIMPPPSKSRACLKHHPPGTARRSEMRMKIDDLH